MSGLLKRTLAVTLVLVLAVALVACGGDNKSSEGDGSSDAKDADGTVYELSINYHGPNGNSPGKAVASACENAEKASEGRLTFKQYYDGTFVSYDESIQATINDVIDICYVDAGNLAEVFSANRILSLPLKSDIPSWAGANEVTKQLLEQIPELNAEMQAVGLEWLGITSYLGAALHMPKDMVVTKPEDLKGMTINTAAEAQAFLGYCGASAMNTSATEFYTVLERGIADGWLHNWGAYNDFGCVEVCKSHTVFTSEEKATNDATGLWSGSGGFVMNKEKFDSLPADLQEILKTDLAQFFSNQWGENEVAGSTKGIEDSKAAGHTFTYLDEGQLQLWKDAIAASTPTILKEIQDKDSSIDADAIYEKVCELYQAQYDKENA